MSKNDLPNDAPVGELIDGKFVWNTEGGPDEWRKRQNYNGKLYAKNTVTDLQARLDLATHERDNLLETCEKLDTEVATLQKADPVVPDVLFDGYSVLSALDEHQLARTSPENVSDTLDAVVRLLRAEATISKPTSEQKNADRYLISDTRYPIRTVGGDVLLLGDEGASSENGTPFYDVEDEARSLCDELLSFGMDRCTLQRALSKAYAAGKGGVR